MARKRNYKAEEARRNEIARSLGYKNRAQMRKAIETGKIAPRQPSRVRSPRTVAAQKFRAAMEKRGMRPTITRDDTYESAAAKISKKSQCEDWSDIHARHPSGTFDIGQERYRRGHVFDSDPTDSAKRDFIKAHGIGAYVDAYYKAFVHGDRAYKNARNRGGSYELYYWLVVVTQYMTVPEYEDKYGGL